MVTDFAENYKIRMGRIIGNPNTTWRRRRGGGGKWN